MEKTKTAPGPQELNEQELDHVTGGFAYQPLSVRTDLSNKAPAPEPNQSEKRSLVKISLFDYASMSRTATCPDKEP